MPGEAGIDSTAASVASWTLGSASAEIGGLVGMDLLRGTVLTVSGDPHRPVLWQVASN